MLSSFSSRVSNSVPPSTSPRPNPLPSFNHNHNVNSSGKLPFPRPKTSNKEARKAGRDGGRITHQASRQVPSMIRANSPAKRVAPKAIVPHSCLPAFLHSLSMIRATPARSVSPQSPFFFIPAFLHSLSIAPPPFFSKIKKSCKQISTPCTYPCADRDDGTPANRLRIEGRRSTAPR